MQQEFGALVFGPTLSPGGIQGTLIVSSRGIEVTAGEYSKRATFSEVALREVGFGQFGLELAWQEADGMWVAHVLDTESARRVLMTPQLASTSQALALQSKQRRHKVNRAWVRLTLAIIATAPLILLLLLVLNSGRIAGWIAERIPVQQESKWGREAFANMQANLKLKDSGTAYDALQTIGAKLTAGSAYRYEFHIVDDATLNAFALPGGIIIVHSGLIAATHTPEELAGVLAHEVQHVELRHSIRGVIKNLGLRGLWSFATGDLGSTLVGQAALEMTSLKFSRDDESEADDRGFDALIKARIDPSGMAAFFKTMSEQAIDAPAAFLSTHPLSKDREVELENRLTQVKHDFAPLNLGAWPPS